MSHEHSAAHVGLKIGFDIVKIGLKIAAVTAAFCAVKELRTLHETVEKHHFIK